MSGWPLMAARMRMLLLIICIADCLALPLTAAEAWFAAGLHGVVRNKTAHLPRPVCPIKLIRRRRCGRLTCPGAARP